MQKNIDNQVVNDFGDEWTFFDQSRLNHEESDCIFRKYFSLVQLEERVSLGRVADLGCGSGRWALHMSHYCDELIAIDPSNSVEVARKILRDCENVEVIKSSIDELELPDNSFDFAYSLGVLHHVPDTAQGIASCVKKVKSGGKFLVYLYYAFDNKPWWFRSIWKSSELARSLISISPFVVKVILTFIIASLIYLPLSRISLLLSKLGLNVENIPLSAYKDNSFFTMRTDALDRFGTKLEQRFTKAEIKKMMESAGLVNVKFREGLGAPYWVAIGTKK